MGKKNRQQKEQEKEQEIGQKKTNQKSPDKIKKQETEVMEKSVAEKKLSEIEKSKIKKNSKFAEFVKRSHLKKVIVGMAILAFLLMIIVPVGIYFYGPLGRITRPIFKKIPYPVAFVGEKRDMISTKELIQNADAVKKFYEDQDLTDKGLIVDFSTPDGKMRLKIREKDVLNKHVEDQVIKQLANQNGIFITKEDAQKELDDTVKKAGSKKGVELRLASLYGWGFDDLRDKVVVYQMYTNRLLEKYKEISQKQDEYMEMVKAKKELKDDGSNFAAVCDKYSEGESAKNGGELGWFPLDKINVEVVYEILEYEKGQISGIIPSRLGFHIVELQDIRDIENILEADDVARGLKKGDIIKTREVKIRQIFKPGLSFVEWIEKQKKETKVSVWMKEYEWDKDTGSIRFKDEKMRLLEKKVRARSVDDPSIKQ
jgi:hypothetical protein